MSEEVDPVLCGQLLEEGRNSSGVKWPDQMAWVQMDMEALALSGVDCIERSLRWKVLLNQLKGLVRTN